MVRGGWATTTTFAAFCGVASEVEETMAVVRRIAEDARAPTVTCVCQIDWRAYAEATGRCEDELLEVFVGRGHACRRGEAKTPPTMERADALATVLACVERIVGKRIDDVSAPFMDSGVDSIASTELADELSRAFSMKLSSTFLFDYPTPAAAARFVVGERALEKTTPIRDVVDDETTRGRGRAVFVGGVEATRSRASSARRIPYEKWDVDALRRRCDFPGHILRRRS